MTHAILKYRLNGIIRTAFNDHTKAGNSIYPDMLSSKSDKASTVYNLISMYVQCKLSQLK